LDAHRGGKAVVIKTSTRKTIFNPVVGLVSADQLKPNDLVGVNKDSYLVRAMHGQMRNFASSFI
jgi:26S proteasome regulatory subunit T5